MGVHFLWMSESMLGVLLDSSLGLHNILVSGHTTLSRFTLNLSCAGQVVYLTKQLG